MASLDAARQLAAIICAAIGKTDVATLRQCELRIRQALGGKRIYIRNPESPGKRSEAPRSDATRADV